MENWAVRSSAYGYQIWRITEENGKQL